MKRESKVVLFNVKTSRMKVMKIVKTAQFYFEKKEPLLFKVLNQKAAEYLDLLLWQWPKESFLPHAISPASPRDLLVITYFSDNPNQASALFNLSGSPIENEKFTFTQLYELEESNMSASKRYQSYKKQGYTITVE